MIEKLWGYMLATIVVAIAHSSLPTHWLSFVAVAKQQKWNFQKLCMSILLAGSGHAISTLILAFLVIGVGTLLQERLLELAEPIAGLILLLLGGTYILRHPGHREVAPLPDSVATGALFLELFLSPCEVAVPLFLASLPLGWHGIIILGVVFTFTTLAVMTIWAVIGRTMLEKIRIAKLARYESFFLGGILILLGSLMLLGVFHG